MEVWDDYEDSAPVQAPPSVYEESGFSVGRGRGFGSKTNKPPQVGSNSSFNSAPVSNNNNDGWNDDMWDEGGNSAQNNVNNNRYSETNNSRSNYSNSNNYNSENSYKPRDGNKFNSSGGGYKQRNDRNVCFNCQQNGHISKFCPNGGTVFKKKEITCHKCQETGHFARDCTNSGSGGGSGGQNRGCFKCHQEGHMARDCPNSENGYGQSRNTCHKCKEPGHMARECPNGGGDGQSSGCYKCGEEGHISRDCPNKDSRERSKPSRYGNQEYRSRDFANSNDGDSRSRSSKCYKCQEEGHMAKDCPSASDGDSRSRSSKCYKCQEEGHMAKDCPSASDGDGRSRSSKCFRCQEDGHMAKDCPNPDTRTGPDGKPRAPIYIPPDPSDNADEIFEPAATGINFSKYDSIAVDVTGHNKPNPIYDFKSAKLSELLQKNVEKSSYKVPTPIQKYCIPIIMNGRDVMACAETGSGKTAAFLLPILHNMITDPNLPNNANNEVQEPIAVVLSPTRELAIQIYNEARKFAYDSVVKTEVVYGGTSVSHQLGKIRRGVHILVATPGRLLDFVEKGKVAFSNLRYLILDEADRMLEMGFRSSIETIIENQNIPPKGERQTLMFSATFPEEIQQLAGKFLNDYLFVTVGNVGGANTDVTQTFFKLGQFEKREKLMEILTESGSDRVLVFVEQKRTADFLASFTSQKDIPTTSIHGDRLQKEREEALRDFRRGKMPVLVATAVAARGLDIKDVRHVINYDLPQTVDEYVHRIGRTGRVGNKGKATSFYDSENDQPLARSLKKMLMDANQEIPEWLHEEANMAVGTAPQGGRGNFGGRDVRNQGRYNNRASSNDAWDDAPPTNNYSQPVDTDECWD